MRGSAEKFMPEEWRKADDVRKCRECMPMRCHKCRKAKASSQYTKQQLKLGEGHALCNDCDRKRCGACNKAKVYKDFDPSVWDLADGSNKCTCRECTRGRRTRGFWVCRNKLCQLQKPIDDFSVAKARHGEGLKGNSRICNECIRRREAEEPEMAQKTMSRIQKKRKTH